MRHVYESAALIQSSIDRGCPVATNALEHSRVAIGYNSTHLLFADSWGTNYCESNKLATDCNLAGFSIVDKWLIYCWVRDILIVERSAPRALQQVECSANQVNETLGAG